MSTEVRDGPSIPPGAAFVAATGGGVYYWIGSGGWQAISPLDRVWFPTETAAQEAGYTPAEESWDRLDDFEILGELGRGGSSIVYHARDRTLGREVAIKVIPSVFGDDPEAVGRFAQEARLLAGLRHPNIVAAFSFKQLRGGGLALIMEYVSGTTLRHVLNLESPLPVERVERILQDISSALTAAHEHGIVHRDVKPDNIFIEEKTGRAMLADFGIALNLDDPSGLTMAGTAIGTPNYMSPEQIDGHAIDGRSDLYSLGLIGWEMLCGEKPWEGETLYSVVYKQKHEELPALSGLRAGVPPRLSLAIEGAIAKDVRARWQSVEEFHRLLTDESADDPWERWAALFSRRRQALPVPRESTVPATDSGEATVFFRRGHEVLPALLPDAGTGTALTVISASAKLQALREKKTRNRKRSLILAGLMAISVLGLVIGLREPLAAPKNGSSVSREAITRAEPVGSPGASAGAWGGPSGPSGLATADSMGVLLAGDSVLAGSALEDSAVAEAAAAPAVPLLPVARSASLVAAGGLHSCQIQSNGAAACWGGNDRGQLGTGDRRPLAEPASVPLAAGAQAVVAGGFHTCALGRDGTATCWGDNADGQLGGGAQNASVPAAVASTRFLFLTLGNAHTCGIGRDERAYCWGLNSSGQLGDGTRSSRSAPTRVRIDHALATLAAGWNHTCGLSRQGQVFCWGDNAQGQLGDGSTTRRALPIEVAIESRFTSITTGSAHTCALSTEGRTYCWGQNSEGRLGDGSTTDRAAPTQVRTSNRFTQITAGAAHTCALTGDGSAFCWGRNSYGQLGTGSTASRSEPARVLTDARFTSISAAGAHTCARTAAGENYCWGYNIEGQVGDGTRTHRSTPQLVGRSLSSNP